MTQAFDHHDFAQRRIAHYRLEQDGARGVIAALDGGMTFSEADIHQRMHDISDVVRARFVGKLALYDRLIATWSKDLSAA